MNWTVIASRDALGSMMSGEWTEYLCFQAPAGKVLLVVCIHEPVEVPRDWYDEDGELLPEFGDEYGEIRLPAVVDGVICEGFDGENLLGPLAPDPNVGEVELHNVDAAAVAEALETLEWENADPALLAASIRQALA